MLMFPYIGRKAWIATDVYETMCAVPVTIIPRRKSDLWELVELAPGKKPKYAVRWQICAEKKGEYGCSENHEDYYIDSKRDLYRSEARAMAAIRRMARRRQSRERRRRK